MIEERRLNLKNVIGDDNAPDMFTKVLCAKKLNLRRAFDVLHRFYEMKMEIGTWGEAMRNNLPKWEFVRIIDTIT